MLHLPTHTHIPCPCPADETDVVCAAACAALAQLLQAADSQQLGGVATGDAAASVLADLTDTVHKRLGGLLGTALARFRCGAAGRGRAARASALCSWAVD